MPTAFMSALPGATAVPSEYRSPWKTAASRRSEILDASHETKQFLRRAKRLLTTVVETQSWEVDAVSEATYTSRGILGAVQNALTGEVVNNPLPPQPKPTAPLVVEEFTAPSTYLDGIYTAEAMGFEGQDHSAGHGGRG